MTTISSLSEDEARGLWSGSRPGRDEYFFTTVAATWTVWAWDFETGLLEIDDQDNALVPLWPHPRLAVMAAEAMGFEDVDPAVPIDVDVLLDEAFERFHREGHEIAVLPTGGQFTTILSLERFRVKVFEARLQAAGLTEPAARARREEFYADQVRRADRRLDLAPDDRQALVDHLRERLASAECDHRVRLSRRAELDRGQRIVLGPALPFRGEGAGLLRLRDPRPPPEKPQPGPAVGVTSCRARTSGNLAVDAENRGDAGR